MKRTPLYDIHLEEGARIVPFAGWEMPIQYKGGIRQEHLFVRSDAGLFDVSHMGQINLRGPDSLPFLQHLLPRDLQSMQIGQLAYAVMCTDRGGGGDDLAVYKLGVIPSCLATATLTRRVPSPQFHSAAASF